jgi:hypothetical protein
MHRPLGLLLALSFPFLITLPALLLVAVVFPDLIGGFLLVRRELRGTEEESGRHVCRS